MELSHYQGFQNQEKSLEREPKSSVSATVKYPNHSAGLEKLRNRLTLDLGEGV